MGLAGRIHASCDAEGENLRIQSADKPVAAIDKGMAGPGLLGFIVTSKFGTYTPLYRRMIERVQRCSHLIAIDDTHMPMLAKDKTYRAYMWVYIGDDEHPYSDYCVYLWLRIKREA